MSSEEGILLLHKPSGITSFQALHRVKKVFGTNKVGHGGTLDRFAEGILLVFIGRYTRLGDLFLDFEKEYEGVIAFGTETDTLDPEGSIVATGPAPPLQIIQRAVNNLHGVILQAPPAFSAVHIDGERAYRKARRGTPIEPPKRPVIIHSIDIKKYEPPFLTLRVRCGKGTYIRSLARDLGRDCGTVAHLHSLVRLRIGPFTLGKAILPSELERNTTLLHGKEFFSTLFPSRVLIVPPSLRIHEGRPLHPSLWENVEFHEGPYILIAENGVLLGAAEYQRERLFYRFVVAKEPV